MQKINPNIIYTTEFLLSPQQTKKLEEAAEILEEMNRFSNDKKGRFGMVIAQIDPIRTLPGSPAKVRVAVIPYYKGKRIVNLMWKRPSGKIKRRKYYKKAKRSILNFFKIKHRNKPRQYWKDSDQNMTGNPSNLDNDIPF